MLRREGRTSGGNASISRRCYATRDESGSITRALAHCSSACMDKLGVALAHCESKCKNFYDAAEVERVLYPEIEKLLLEFFPGATDALVYNHDVFNKEYKGPVRRIRANKDPG